MGKTSALRKLVTQELQTVPGQTYHRTASPDADYPYKTYELSASFPNSCQVDYELTVDIWSRSQDWKEVEDIADQIEEIFNDANLPQDTILPTFFRESRTPVDDPDKYLQHIQLQFYVHLYEKEE